MLCAIFFVVRIACAGAAVDYTAQRERMVVEAIEAAGITDVRVLRSLRTTPRHEFVPRGLRRQAYFDAALPIGDKQTISPPFIVAYMTEQLDPQPEDRVLEIGTGSGYQAAVLSPLVKEVDTIEIVERLGRRAKRTLKRLGYENVYVRIGDGYQGWPEKAPFDKIIVTCSPERIPAPLVEQLKDGGQMIIPVGERYQQNLYRVTKQDGKLQREPLQATLFVPMTGKAEKARQVLPDPRHPRIVNGGFEQILAPEAENGVDLPVGWHYLRQTHVVSQAGSAPQGKRYLSLTNAEPGRACLALQGLALDGRAISRVILSATVRGRDLRVGPTPGQQAAVIVTFYDQRRAAIESERLGPWEGTFDWRTETAQLRVPLAAREAIVRLGLLGGVGQLDLDGVSLQAADPE